MGFAAPFIFATPPEGRAFTWYFHQPNRIVV